LAWRLAAALPIRVGGPKAPQLIDARRSILPRLLATRGFYLPRIRRWNNSMTSYRITEDKAGPVTMRIFAAASDQEAAVVAQRYADDESEAEAVTLDRRSGRLADDSVVLIGRFIRCSKQEGPTMFVVKIIGRTDSPTWLAPSPEDSHTFGPRKYATLFPTKKQAQAAADKASESFADLGMTFTVETVE
jgi:hypothetical protein